jgi:hypothetical protein
MDNNPEDIKIKYGSGLNSNIPYKSPLTRSLWNALSGDCYTEVNSPEATD